MMGSRDLEKDNRAVNNHNNNNNNTRGYTNYAAAASSYGIETSEQRQWTSWLVPMIVVANVVIFIVAMYVNNCPKNHFGFDGCVARFLGRLSFQPLRENPLLGPSSHTLVKMGALQWEKVVHQHEGWRLITCIWLHAGVIHLLANMMSLVFIGIRLEQEFGFVRVGILYLLSGLGGSLLSALFLQKSISVGASGALFGLLGAMLSELFTNWTIYANKAGALFTLMVIIAINLAVGILPHVDNFAHIGGFVTGFLLGFVLLLRPRFGWLERHQLPEHARVKTKYLPYQLVLFFVSLAVLIAWFIAGMVMLFKGKNGNDHCGWCRYLICVPTSRWECGN